MTVQKKEEQRYLLDVKGYVCPFPSLYAMRSLGELSKGDVLEVLTDNPASCQTMPYTVERQGYKVLAVEKLEKNVWRIVIAK